MLPSMIFIPWHVPHTYKVRYMLTKVCSPEPHCIPYYKLIWSWAVPRIKKFKIMEIISKEGVQCTLLKVKDKCTSYNECGYRKDVPLCPVCKSERGTRYRKMSLSSLCFWSKDARKVIFKELGQEWCCLYSVRKSYQEFWVQEERQERYWAGGPRHEAVNSACGSRKRDRKDMQRLSPGRVTVKKCSVWDRKDLQCLSPGRETGT